MAVGDGLVSMEPTSISHTGTSAVINADGGVDFSAVTVLSLDGVFTSSYVNYLISIRLSGGNLDTGWQFRASGVDATGTNYSRQVVAANSTTVSAVLNTSQTRMEIMNVGATQNGAQVFLYGPALAQPTAVRATQVSGVSGAYLLDFVCSHSLSSAYDGITITALSSSMSGTVHAFGYEE